MSKYIPVDPEKWAKMVQAQSDLPRWKEMCDELDARCNELKAEIARLKALTERMNDTINLSQAECRRLKAEVERLNDAIMRGASVPDAYPVSEEQP
jgi:uncharacterized small protein (DUF1192 family)